MAALQDQSDEELMVRYQQGETRAFEILLVRHEGPIYNFIYRSVGQRALAEDLLQEVFMRVIKSARDYQASAKLTTWLYTIARNLCVDASRRAKHRRAASLDQPLDQTDGNGSSLGELVADERAAVERHAIDHELCGRIERAVARLTDEQREVFVLRELMDLPFKEIAEITRVPENTVKSRMRYALEKLREELREYADLAKANVVR